MNRICAWCLGLAALSANLVFVHGEDTQKPRTDLYGDPLPPGAVARMGTIQMRHVDAVFTFSPDGKHLISLAPRGDVCFWDVAAGKLHRRRQLWRTTERVSDTGLRDRSWQALSPDGATAARQDGEEVRFYDTRTGRIRGRLAVGPARHDGTREMFFSTNGKMLIVWESKDRENSIVQWWDIESGKLRWTLKLPFFDLRTIICTPDGNRLARLHGYGAIHVWDVSAGKEIGCIENATSASSLLSPDGKTLAAESTIKGKSTVRLWDAATLKEKAVLDVPADFAISCIEEFVFSPDGRFLAAVRRVSYLDKAKKHLLVWDLSGRTKPRYFPECNLQWVAIAPGGKTLACCAGDREIRLWDMTSGRQLHPRPGGLHRVDTLAASSDGRFLASNAPTVCLWDASTGKPLRVFDEVGGEILISPDGKRVIAANKPSNEEERFLVWEAATGKELRRLLITRPPNSSYDFSHVKNLGISADGKRLTAAGWDYFTRTPQVYQWEIDTGQLLAGRSYPDKENCGPIAVSPDGERVCLVRERQLSIEEARTGRRLQMLPKTIRDIVFSPDGHLLAARTAPDKRGLSLLETASGKEVLRLSAAECNLFTFTPDGRGLVGVDDKALHVWGVGAGKLLHEMAWPASVMEEQDESVVHALVVLPGGRAATGMSDTTVLVWDLAASTWPRNGLARNLTRRELDALWADLGGEAAAAHRALHTLAASPTTALPYLGECLPRATAAATKRVERLLADLDSDSYPTRETASQELRRMASRVEPMLRWALQNKPSLEMRRRIEAILAEPPFPATEDLQLLRAIVVLEHIGTSEARGILEKLAGGAESPETRDAQATLQRLKQRDAGTKEKLTP